MVGSVASLELAGAEDRASDDARDVALGEFGEGSEGLLERVMVVEEMAVVEGNDR